MVLSLLSGQQVLSREDSKMTITKPVAEPVNAYAALSLQVSIDRMRLELARRGLIGGGK